MCYLAREHRAPLAEGEAAGKPDPLRVRPRWWAAVVVGAAGMAAAALVDPPGSPAAAPAAALVQQAAAADAQRTSNALAPDDGVPVSADTPRAAAHPCDHAL
jgi:hypothetical protein